MIYGPQLQDDDFWLSLAGIRMYTIGSYGHSADAEKHAFVFFFRFFTEIKFKIDDLDVRHCPLTYGVHIVKPCISRDQYQKDPLIQQFQLIPVKFFTEILCGSRFLLKARRNLLKQMPEEMDIPRGPKWCNLELRSPV